MSHYCVAFKCPETHQTIVFLEDVITSDAVFHVYGG